MVKGPNHASRVRTRCHSRCQSIFQGLESGMKNERLKRQLQDWTEFGDNPRMAWWGRRKLFPKVVSSHWYTWKTGMVPLPERCARPAEPAPGRERRRHLLYLESGGIWPHGGRCLCSRWAFNRKMTGGARPQERTGEPCNKREKKDRPEINNAICRQKWFDFFKISSLLTAWIYLTNPFIIDTVRVNVTLIYMELQLIPNIQSQHIVYINRILLYFRTIFLLNGPLDSINANVYAHYISWRKIYVE